MAAALSLAFGASAWADTLAMPEGSAAPTLPAHVPQRGASMAAVTKEFGEPKLKHAAVGGGKPKQPPITRWDYDGFTVVFERSKVVDVVLPEAPVAPVQHTEELKPAP